MTLLAKQIGPTHIVALQKITQAITGLATALMVAHFLTPEEQGYYYTMGSLLSGYIVFDLGLSSYLLQRSAQLSNGLTIDRVGNINPNGMQRKKFLEFIHWSFRWYRNAGIVAFIVMTPIGLWVLASNGYSQINSNWVFPWLLIMLAIPIYMPTISFFSVLEGAGRVQETYLLRIAHYVIGAIFAWCLISAGSGLYSQVSILISTVLVSYIWYFYKYRSKFTIEEKNSTANTLSNTLSHVRHTASVLLANYIFLNAPTLLCFVIGGVASSGQLGLSIAIANVGGAIAMSTVTAKMPSIIKHIESGNHAVARENFKRSISYYFKLYLLGSVALVFLAVISNGIYPFTRLLEPCDLALLMLSFSIIQPVHSKIMFQRAYGNNRLSLSFFIVSCLSILSCIFMSRFGITGILLGLLGCAVFLLALILAQSRLKRPTTFISPR